MEIRNLSLFIPDDIAVRGYLPHLFKVNVTPYDWDEHISDCFARKNSTIDLMSADTNFSTDDTDPEDCKKNGWNSWGFAHAIAGLAQRRSTDDHGNALPFAWELRSASPALIRNDPSAIRLYGFLRALAASPRAGESFKQCIEREHHERWQKPLGEDPALDAKSDLVRILVQDFACQNTQDSIQSEMIGRLLPQWRSKLIAAVKDRQVLLHHPTLEKQSAQLAHCQPIMIENDRQFCIPFQDGAGRFAYGINLCSVFADMFDQTAYDQGDPLSLDPSKPYAALDLKEKSYKGPRTIVEWHSHLLNIVTGMQAKYLPSRVASIGEQLEDHFQKKTVQELVDGLDGQYPEKCILFCAMVTRWIALGHEYKDQGDLCSHHGITVWNENTFSRPLRKERHMFPNVGGPDKFAKQLVQALKCREHSLGEHWDNWIKPGLILWITKRKGVDNIAFVRKNVPALLPVEEKN